MSEGTFINAGSLRDDPAVPKKKFDTCKFRQKDFELLTESCCSKKYDIVDRCFKLGLAPLMPIHCFGCEVYVSNSDPESSS